MAGKENKSEYVEVPLQDLNEIRGSGDSKL
jgi:hypothetical protein